MQLIGLRDPVGYEWGNLRSLQYAEIHRVSLMRLAIHGIAALIMIGQYAGKVPNWMLLAWLVALALTQFNSIRIDAELADVRRRRMTRREYWRQARGVMLYAAVWAIPILLIRPTGAEAEHYAVWAITAMMIAGTTAMMAPAPIVTIAFAGIVGSAAALSFVIRAEYVLAVASVAFSSMMVAGSLVAARTYLSARIAEAGVAEKEEVVSLLLREFEENEADWLWQIDTNRCIRSVSPRFAFALGCTPAEAEGQSLVKLISGQSMIRGEEPPPSLRDLAERLKTRQSFSNVIVQVRLASGMRWWELSGTPIIDDGGRFRGYRGVGSDVTEQRESDEKIAWLARYDTLTGMPNRLMVTEALGEALRYAEQWKARCALLMVDLDRFKAVNDSLGHQVGDRMLAQVSERLQSLMTKNESCGRLGGDEFAVVIRDAGDRDHIARIARSVIDTLSQPYLVDNHMLYIGASVGSAIGPRDGDTVETLMRNADLALYSAKDQGGGEHCRYEPSLHAGAEERRKLESALRSAIDKGELSLNYQPVVDAHTESVVSFEALLRWNSKEHGFVSPAKFIPLAEETRLIVPIGEWVLHEACRIATTWPDHIRVAVNVSGEQLLDPDFIHTLVRALHETRLPPARLEVEVTESVFLRDGRIAQQALEDILALGCGIALDDFGTGYSSLGYLRNLRFSTIKVDRSFVEGASNKSPESLAIIRAVVAMADALDMTTTAEGVETEEQAELVCSLGVTKIQGYYYGRPLPEKEANDLVMRGKRAAA